MAPRNSSMDKRMQHELARLSNLITALLKITGDAKTLDEAKEIAANALECDQAIILLQNNKNGAA
jgi:hypothetical protein